jgi:hypothetical protein
LLEGDGIQVGRGGKWFGGKTVCFAGRYIAGKGFPMRFGIYGVVRKQVEEGAVTGVELCALPLGPGDVIGIDVYKHEHFFAGAGRAEDMQHGRVRGQDFQPGPVLEGGMPRKHAVDTLDPVDLVLWRVPVHRRSAMHVHLVCCEPFHAGRDPKRSVVGGERRKAVRMRA